VHKETEQFGEHQSSLSLLSANQTMVASLEYFILGIINMEEFDMPIQEWCPFMPQPDDPTAKPTSSSPAKSLSVGTKEPSPYGLYNPFAYPLPPSRMHLPTLIELVDYFHSKDPMKPRRALFQLPDSHQPAVKPHQASRRLWHYVEWVTRGEKQQQYLDYKEEINARNMANTLLSEAKHEEELGDKQAVVRAKDEIQKLWSNRAEVGKQRRSQGFGRCKTDDVTILVVDPHLVQVDSKDLDRIGHILN